MVADRADYAWAREVIRERDLAARVAAVLLSPVHGTLDPAELVAWMLADRAPGAPQPPAPQGGVARTRTAGSDPAGREALGRDGRYAGGMGSRARLTACCLSALMGLAVPAAARAAGDAPAPDLGPRSQVVYQALLGGRVNPLGAVLRLDLGYHLRLYDSDAMLLKGSYAGVELIPLLTPQLLPGGRGGGAPAAGGAEALGDLRAHRLLRHLERGRRLLRARAPTTAPPPAAPPVTPGRPTRPRATASPWRRSSRRRSAPSPPGTTCGCCGWTCR